MPLAAAEPDPPHAPLIASLLEQHRTHRLPRFSRLWAYYRNDLAERSDDHNQRQGLPPRLRHAGEPAASRDTADREVVIENDIAWRIHALVDFMFAKPVVIESRAADPRRASLIEAFLQDVIDDNGGVGFYQDLALLGAVYGHVDIFARTDARRITLELIDAPRAVPLLNADDYRRFDAYVIHVDRPSHQPHRPGLLERVRDRVLGASHASHRGVIERTEIWTPDLVHTHEAERTAHGTRTIRRETEATRLGRIPVVHIQNLAQPFFYDGLSEVEPLIPLQDELNIRLSDRANRVTFQSFKMYLGKGIEQFTDRPVGPGQMWATDNLDASIESFGGDGHSPSETAHIEQIREAMDKTSAVSPLATGLVRDKIGNLSSENALRVVMLGLLARTEKKRITYGAGITRLCELVLHLADTFGLLPNTPDERAVRLHWPNPVPDDESTRLLNAKRKLEIGVPARQVLAELGYADCDTDAPHLTEETDR